MAEQVLAGSQKYHKRCFTCNNKPTCNKSLGGGIFNEHAGNYQGRHVIKQLLDEVEHDIMNYQNRGLCYLPKPSASADNSDLGFDNS